MIKLWAFFIASVLSLELAPLKVRKCQMQFLFYSILPKRHWKSVSNKVFLFHLTQFLPFSRIRQVFLCLFSEVLKVRLKTIKICFWDSPTFANPSPNAKNAIVNNKWILGQKVFGGFQLLDLIITELKSNMTCYNSMPLIGWNYSIQTGEQIL